MIGLIPGSDILLAVAACGDEAATVDRLCKHLERRRDNLVRSIRTAVVDETLAFDGETAVLTDKGRRIIDAERIAAGEGEPGSPLPAAGPVVVLRWDEIEEDPANPRTDLDTDESRESIEQLRAQIILRGEILQPVWARPRGETGKHRLIFGHRRWRAVGRAIEDGDLAEDFPIKAEIRDLDDAEALVAAVEENVARRDMHPLDEAAAFRKLIRDHGWSSQAVADRFDVGVKTVQDRLAVVEKLDDATKSRMRLPADDPDHLTYKAARQLLRDQGAAARDDGIWDKLDTCQRFLLCEIEAECRNHGYGEEPSVHVGARLALFEPFEALTRHKLVVLETPTFHDGYLRLTRLGESVARSAGPVHPEFTGVEPMLGGFLMRIAVAKTGTARVHARPDAAEANAPETHGPAEDDLGRAGGSTAAARKRALAAAEMLIPAERLILCELAHRIRRHGRMITRPGLGDYEAEYARAVPSRGALADVTTWSLSQPDRWFIFNWTHFPHVDRARGGEDVSALTPLAQRALSHFAPALANLDRPDAQADAELLEALEQAGHDPAQYLLGQWYLTGWLNERWRDEILSPPAEAPAPRPAPAAIPAAPSEPGSPEDALQLNAAWNDFAADVGERAEALIDRDEAPAFTEATLPEAFDGLAQALVGGDLAEAALWLAVLSRRHRPSTAEAASGLCAAFGRSASPAF